MACRSRLVAIVNLFETNLQLTCPSVGSMMASLFNDVSESKAVVNFQTDNVFFRLLEQAERSDSRESIPQSLYVFK